MSTTFSRLPVLATEDSVTNMVKNQRVVNEHLEMAALPIEGIGSQGKFGGALVPRRPTSVRE